MRRVDTACPVGSRPIIQSIMASGSERTLEPDKAGAMSYGDEEPAPIFGSWGRLYAAIVGYLFLLILLFYAFTVTFAGKR